MGCRFKSNIRKFLFIRTKGLRSINEHWYNYNNTYHTIKNIEKEQKLNQKYAPLAAILSTHRYIRRVNGSEKDIKKEKK